MKGYIENTIIKCDVCGSYLSLIKTTEDVDVDGKKSKKVIYKLICNKCDYGKKQEDSGYR
ncbi:MAG TPA: hypothetical protein ENJ27_00785 [Candidatus Moranbacteria bacterium]|nr:hypothetical protein [Candidatus Moranbacteria bacterium]